MKQSGYRLNLGSSPRVWGQEAINAGLEDGSRIIPTRMGTSYMLSLFTGTPGDHPHAYGDKDNGNISMPTTSGSSPRVWGQEDIVRLVLRSTWIIPTRMGTSMSFAYKVSAFRDHPHAYGDKSIYFDT